jgi:hypothetical protein
MIKRHFVSSFMRFLVVFTVLLGIAITVPTSSALASCFQNDCNGKDPQIEGCEDKTTTVSHRQIVISGEVVGNVERRKSTKCLTQWTRIVPFRTLQQITFEEAQLQELIGLPPKWRTIVGSTVNSNGHQTIWSKMYSYVNKIHRACGTIKTLDLRTGEIKSGTSCTT